MGTGFPGGTYHQVFYVADVEASGPPMDGERHVDLDEADFLAIFPLAGLGEMGISVERQTELIGHSDEGERIVALLRGPSAIHWRT